MDRCNQKSGMVAKSYEHYLGTSRQVGSATVVAFSHLQKEIQ